MGYIKLRVIMSIKLEYVLRRNKSDLRTFIKKNKLTSYLVLLEYCLTRRFIPCTEEDYNQIVKVKLEIKNEPAVDREVSKTQKPKKRRNSRKKKSDTPKLSNRIDKR